MRKLKPSTIALRSAKALLAEHYPAGILIVPNGKAPKVVTFGDESFVRGLIADVTGENPAKEVEEEDEE